MAVEMDVILLAGQSNGFGRGYNDPAYLANLDPIMAPLGTRFRPDEIADNGFQPDNGSDEGSIRTSLVNRWREQTGRPVACWKSAFGGTSLFADAQPPTGSVAWWEPTVKPTLFDQAVPRFNSYTQTMIGYGFTPVVRGLIWIQGENEAEYWINRWPGEKPALVNRYANGLVELIDAFRLALGNPGLRMYLPLLGSHSNPVHRAGYANIVEAQQKAATLDSNIRICFTRTPEFWTDVPPKHFDGVHYSQAGYNELGAGIADYVRVDQLVPTFVTGPASPPLDGLPTLLPGDAAPEAISILAGSPRIEPTHGVTVSQ